MKNINLDRELLKLFIEAEEIDSSYELDLLTNEQFQFKMYLIFIRFLKLQKYIYTLFQNNNKEEVSEENADYFFMIANIIETNEINKKYSHIALGQNYEIIDTRKVYNEN